MLLFGRVGWCRFERTPKEQAGSLLRSSGPPLPALKRLPRKRNNMSGACCRVFDPQSEPIFFFLGGESATLTECRRVKSLRLRKSKAYRKSFQTKKKAKSDKKLIFTKNCGCPAREGWSGTSGSTCSTQLHHMRVAPGHSNHSQSQTRDLTV